MLCFWRSCSRLQFVRSSSLLVAAVDVVHCTNFSAAQDATWDAVFRRVIMACRWLATKAPKW
eukprot:6473888-Amphidinium_carterae.1